MDNDDIAERIHNAFIKLGSTKRGKENIQNAKLFLQALLNLGGNVTSNYEKTAYFKIYNEMKKINYDVYLPSYTVKILKEYGIVEKTGSNKYPEWNIPEEMRNVIQIELEKIC